MFIHCNDISGIIRDDNVMIYMLFILTIELSGIILRVFKPGACQLKAGMRLVS